MKRGFKIITTSISLVIVLSSMIIGIYAATLAQTQVLADLSWVSTTFEVSDFALEANVVNNSAGSGIDNTSTPKSLPKISVIDGLSNAPGEGDFGNLNCNFYDETRRNAPAPIVFTYKVTNNDSDYDLICTAQAPNEREESGNTPATHVPKVAHSGSLNGVPLTSSQHENLISSTGLIIPVGQTLVFVVTLSLRAGSQEVEIDADIAMTTPFDASVTFIFS